MQQPADAVAAHDEQLAAPRLPDENVDGIPCDHVPRTQRNVIAPGDDVIERGVHLVLGFRAGAPRILSGRRLVRADDLYAAAAQLCLTQGPLKGGRLPIEPSAATPMMPFVMTPP